MWLMTSEFAARAADAVPLAAGARVLDVAAGSGTASVVLAERAAALPNVRVVASDISPGMLAELRRMAEARGVAAAIETVEEDAMALGAADASFDAAISVFGIPLVPQPPAAAAELARVLRPGGTAVIMWWERVPATELVLRLLEALDGDPADAAAVQARFATYDSGDKVRALLEGAGLAVTRVDHVTLPFRLQEVVRDHPRTLLANPILGKYLASVPHDRALELLAQTVDQHAADWATATASLVVATKKDEQ